MSGKDCSKEQDLTVSRMAICLNGSRMAISRLVECGAMPAARFGHPFCLSEAAAEQHVHDAETPGPGT